MSTGSTRQPDHRSTFAAATTMAEVAPGPESVPAPGAEPEVGPALGPGASTSDTRSNLDRVSQSGSALVYVVGLLAFVLIVLPALMFATRVLTQVGQAMGD